MFSQVIILTLKLSDTYTRTYELRSITSTACALSHCKHEKITQASSKYHHYTVLYTMLSAACNFLPWPATSLDCTSPSLPLYCSYDVCHSNSFTYATCRFQSSISLQYPLLSYSFWLGVISVRTVLHAETASSRNPQNMSLFAKQKRWFDS